jgi:hypothetical protein
MGSQKLEAPNIEYVVNNDSHPGAQFSEQFHSIVKIEVARISALETVQTAQAKPFKPSQLAKLPPPKDVKSTALAFANAETPRHEPAKVAQSTPAQVRPEQTRQQPAPQTAPTVFADVPKPQPVFADARKPQPVFADAFLTSANAGNLFVQRTLTISDMKEYVKRNYPTAQTADVTR